MKSCCSAAVSAVKALLNLAWLAPSIAERRAIKIRVRRPHVHDARLEQRLLGGNRKLLIDEIDDAGVLGAGNQRLAHGAQRGRLFGVKRAQRNVLRLRLPGRQHDLGAADGKRQRADGRALHEGAPLNLVHDFSSRDFA